MKIKSLVQLTLTICCIALTTSCTTTSENSNNSPNAIASATTSVIPSSSEVSPPVETANNSSPSCESAQTQAQINQCASQAAKTADKKLNQVYQQLQATIKNPPQKRRLISAQQKWIQFRDADCEYARGKYEGGSFAPANHALCIARVTEQRTEDLTGYIENASR
ncbi:MAG: DUF1311 domain-containing protein [Kastovskya adunca ATA6-11-RM4]|jgi:uncharacterized protein YecT (DUF1311 family)|nr:DUF1311 domain-containing protein [Kastovskya adunca ATA6-11-RM4]